MEIKFHPGMTVEKWGAKPYTYQLLNIASELSRARSWIKEHETERLRRSLERALELIDLTVSSNQGAKPLRDLLRLREEFAGYYLGLHHEYDQFTRLLISFVNLDIDVQKLGIKIAD
jgi:hypothetical protein